MARVHFKYRLAKEVYRTVKEGPSFGRSQYIGRQVWRLSKSEPGGNYANPKRRRS